MDDATRAQVIAARPDQSTWLSANAGSGKTRVLTDRVARLLLEGVDPQHILCLTYTKAAASEMQNRLFRRLGAWAMLPDDALTAQLAGLGAIGGGDMIPLRKARRLFATAIETPGGLRIQTIHSFCAALLRRFPLEAGVSPQFTEMDDLTAARLRDHVVEEMAIGLDSTLFQNMARMYSGAEFDDLLREILSHRGRFEQDVDLFDLLNIAPGTTRHSIAASVFLGDEQDILQQLLPALRAGGKTDAVNCDRLSDLGALDFNALGALEQVFLTGKSAKEPFSAKIGAVPTKSVQKQIPDLMDRINNWMLRVEDARETRLAYLTLHRTQVVTAFARAFLAAYDAAKSRRGLLDFDDLILKTGDLLTDTEVAAWVLFRLDGGIDHILVDEAQDTSPDQWRVIAQLAQELTSGEGARSNRARTMFVVGDKKQSIYSFQGADPRAFDDMCDWFSRRLEHSDAPLARRSLKHSFRSSSAILDVVDATFANAGEAGFSPEQSHISFHDKMPGRVDLWPIVEKPEQDDPPPWYMPVDIRAEDDPAVILSEQIADQIKSLVDSEHPIPDQDAPGGWRAISPGDVLILVQSRKRPIFREVIRACKARHLPVAGADRLILDQELPVRDLVALLSFLATPEDDLALASALRSPLFGWTEQQLYSLAQPRGRRYLWAALRDVGDQYPETMAILNDLRDQADYLRPYDLIERMLTRHSGRTKLLARLGPEAEDGIDALMSQALNFEKNAIDSLTGFLVWMQQGETEIKRQLDSAGDMIRVMTVHGAKGLESPIVILPDCAKRKPPPSGNLVLANDAVLWKSSGDEVPGVARGHLAAQAERQRAERDRLLYVAMTRAEKWLIVAAAGDTGAGSDSWYSQIADGLVGCSATALKHAGGAGLRYSIGDWATVAQSKTAADQAATPMLPNIFHHPAPAPASAPETLGPSDLPGAKALADAQGRDTDTALREGRALHLLLEKCPDTAPQNWPGLADQIATLENVTPAPMLATVTDLIHDPRFVHLFADGTLAEVAVSATLSELGNRRIHGIIDRMVIAPDHVLIVDYKTNVTAPRTSEQVPDGILRQMGAYRAAVTQIYPERRIDVAILWTATRDLMLLPHDLVTAALQNTHIA